jgi:alpha-mannosidase
VPPTQSLVALEKGRLTLTCLKVSEAGTTAVVRLVNLSDRVGRDSLRFARKVRRYRPCTLEEAPAGAWTKPQAGRLDVEARPQQLVSLEIEWAD